MLGVCRAGTLAVAGVLLLPIGVTGSAATATQASADPAQIALSPNRQQSYTLADVTDAWTDSVGQNANQALRGGGW